MNKTGLKSAKGVGNFDTPQIISAESIESRIFIIRGMKVMFDKDLAILYVIDTRALNRSVIRNRNRFPGDFLIELSMDEFENLKYHFGTSSWGGRRKLPFAFTEHGILMLSSVLKSERATQVNISIMRTFVKLHQILTFNKELAQKLNELEHKVGVHDQDIIVLFESINKIMRYEEKPKGKFGFV